MCVVEAGRDGGVTDGTLHEDWLGAKPHLGDDYGLLENWAARANGAAGAAGRLDG